VCQPRLQPGKNAGIVRGHNCLCHLELAQEDCGGLKVAEQIGNRWTLLAVNHKGRGKEQNERTSKPGDRPSKRLRWEEGKLAHTVPV
jgi:hypothetical protein